jgi:hypothetical protein
MSDADERFAERLAEDLARVLGEGIVITDLAIDRDGQVVVRLACLVDGRVQDVEVRADDLLDAYRQVVRAAAELRLAGAFWQMVGPT